jgi:hypothetical protein
MRKFVQIFAVLGLIFFAHTKVASAQACCPPTVGAGFALIRISSQACVYDSIGGTTTRRPDLYACDDDPSNIKVCQVNYADLPASQCTNPPPPVVAYTGCGGNVNYINTAFGCIDSRPGAVISIVLRLGIGMGSGIALLLIIYGSYKVLASQGQPDQINQGKEIITASIIGIVFITLSVTILQIIGVDILGLNDLGTVTPLPLGR